MSPRLLLDPQSWNRYVANLIVCIVSFLSGVAGDNPLLCLLQLHDNMKAIEFVDKITDDVKKKVDDIFGALAFA